MVPRAFEHPLDLNGVDPLVKLLIEKLDPQYIVIRGMINKNVLDLLELKQKKLSFSDRNKISDIIEWMKEETLLEDINNRKHLLLIILCQPSAAIKKFNSCLGKHIFADRQTDRIDKDEGFREQYQDSQNILNNAFHRCGILTSEEIIKAQRLACGEIEDTCRFYFTVLEDELRTQLVKEGIGTDLINGLIDNTVKPKNSIYMSIIEKELLKDSTIKLTYKKMQAIADIRNEAKQSSNPNLDEILKKLGDHKDILVQRRGFSEFFNRIKDIIYKYTGLMKVEGAYVEEKIKKTITDAPMLKI